MKKDKEIDKFNVLYALLRKYICFMLSVVFYKKITVKYEETLPANVPVIYAPNHQNALMDALIIICTAPKQTVFFARADIFKNKCIASILRFLKIAPIYRIRDGVEALQQNYKSFSTASGILQRKNAIAVFPEAQHNNIEQLLPLKKGLARIAFQAEAEHDFQLNVHIVPVAISFSDYIKPRSEVVVRFCKAITLNTYKEIYMSNPSQGYNELNVMISNSLKQKIIHICDTDNYITIQNMRKLMVYDKGIASFEENIVFSKEILQKIQVLQTNEHDKYRELILDAKKYKAQLEEHKIHSFEKPIRKGTFVELFLMFLIILICFPLYASAYLLYLLPLIFPYRLINNYIADTQFRSSIFFVLISLVTIPIFVLVLLTIVWFHSQSLVFVLSCIPFSILFVIILKFYRRFWKKFVFLYNSFRLYRNNRKRFQTLLKMRLQLIDLLFKLTKEN
jgi:1-acyl-sn-glycerol-3-phosphate acyltransferase